MQCSLSYSLTVYRGSVNYILRLLSVYTERCLRREGRISEVFWVPCFTFFVLFSCLRLSAVVPNSMGTSDNIVVSIFLSVQWASDLRALKACLPTRCSARLTDLRLRFPLAASVSFDGRRSEFSKRVLARKHTRQSEDKGLMSKWSQLERPCYSRSQGPQAFLSLRPIRTRISSYRTLSLASFSHSSSALRFSGCFPVYTAAVAAAGSTEFRRF